MNVKFWVKIIKIIINYDEVFLYKNEKKALFIIPVYIVFILC